MTRSEVMLVLARVLFVLMVACGIAWIRQTRRVQAGVRNRPAAH